MARESEKHLMKELEQAVVDLDKAAANAAQAKAILDVEAAKLRKAQETVDAYAGAIIALRGQRSVVTITDRENIAREARENARKEKPVA